MSMTDKEAIKYLQQLYPNGGHCWLDEQRIEAISMAIKALQEEHVSNNYSALLPCIYNRTLEERVKYCKYCSAACEGRVKEPVSEELEVELTSYMENSFTSVEEPDEFLTTVMQKDDLLAFARHFANWQKEQDKETIELAEDHAMFAGMEKMKEQMMAKAVDVTAHIDAGGYPYIPQMELYDYDKDVPLAKEGDKYKVILIKEE